MTTRILTIAGAALVAAMTATAATMVLAQEPPPGAPRMRGPGGPPPGGMMGGPMRGPGPMGDLGIPLQALNLTDDQKAQVRSVMESQRDQMQAMMQRQGPAHEALQAAIETSPLDESLIRARSAELAAVEADAAVLRARVRSEIVSLLTPEQQDAVSQMRARRPGPRGGGGPMRQRQLR